MSASPAFVAITLGVLAAIIVLVFLTGRRRQENRLRPLAGLAMAFVLAGILFGEDRVVGYGLMGFGVILAVFDIIIQARST